MGKEKSFTIKLGKDSYPTEAIMATCCQFLRDNYIFLDREKGGLQVKITPKESNALKGVRNEFNQGLISNALRYNVAQKNKDIREYIIKTALFSSQNNKTKDDSLLRDLDGLRVEDWEDDPLGIAIPWEEKKKGKIKKR